MILVVKDVRACGVEERDERTNVCSTVSGIGDYEVVHALNFKGICLWK